MFLGLNVNRIGTLVSRAGRNRTKKSSDKKVEKVQKQSFQDVYTSLLNKELKK